MAEPTSALSYRELITEVARVAGCAYYGTTGLLPAMPPIDNNAFDEIRGIVNRGIKMFIANAPINGWKWRHRKMSVTFAPSFTGTATAGGATSLTDDDIAGDYTDDYFLGFTIGITAGTGIDETAVITGYTGLTGRFNFTALSGGSTPDTTSQYRISRSTAVVTSDPARYQLDEDFGAVESQIKYAANSNRGNKIQWCDESTIRALRAIVVQTGTPKLAAIRPYGTRRFEMIVDPTPTAADIVEFMYKVIFDKLDGETGIATGGSTTTLVDSNQAYRYADDHFLGWTLTILAGTGAGESTVLTGSTSSSGTFTFALNAITTPDATSVYMVEPASNLHPAGIEFDDVILAACRATAQMELEDAEGDNWIQYYYNSALPSAHKIDAKLSPRRLVRSKGIKHERTWDDVTYT
uniref:Uncharacterized protein n=1 Tax=viral metagenome TaxID=1070528 RepID=A0A6M3KYY5_9ZZZZ